MLATLLLLLVTPLPHAPYDGPRDAIAPTEEAVAAPSGSVTMGPWTFDLLAFADDATKLDGGISTLHCGATDIDDALTGYSPDREIANIGYETAGNHYQLDFLDVKALNLTGPDLVFFDVRYSADPYEIAVRPMGEGFTAFQAYAAGDFVTTGVSDGCEGVVWGVEIELDDFGVAGGGGVDAIQFRALTNGSQVEGDPTMAAVLNGTLPTSVDELSWGRIKSHYR